MNTYSITGLAVFIAFSAGCIYLSGGESAQKQDFFNEIPENMEVLGVYKLGEYVKLHPSDSCLIASQQGRIYMFSVVTGKMLWQREVEGLITHVAASQDCDKIAVGTQQIPGVYLFNRTGALEWKYELTGNVNQLAISGAGNLIAVGFGYPESKVYLFDAHGYSALKHEYRKIETSINSISISYYGRYAAVGTGYRYPAITFFDSNKAKWEYKIKPGGAPVSGVYKVRLSQDGELGVAIAENKAFFFDKNGILYMQEEDSDIKAMDFQDKFAAIGTVSGRLSFFNSTGRLWSYNTNHPVDLLKISEDGDFLVAVSGKNVLMFKRTGDVRRIKEFEDAEVKAAISGDNVLIYVKKGSAENISLVSGKGEILWSFIIPEHLGEVKHYLVLNQTCFIVTKNMDTLVFSSIGVN